MPRPQINQTQKERRQRKRTQPQRRGIRELPLLDVPEQTGLELAAEGGVHGLAMGGDLGERTPAKLRCAVGGLVFLLGHAGHALGDGVALREGWKRDAAGVVAAAVAGGLGEAWAVLGFLLGHGEVEGRED